MGGYGSEGFYGIFKLKFCVFFFVFNSMFGFFFLDKNGWFI